MKRIVLPFLLALASLFSVKPIVASDPVPAVVPAFARALPELDQDARGGLLLLGELNCVACHKLDGAEELGVVAKAAPILTHAGSRIRPEYIKKFLESPHTTDPGTTMPSLLEGLDASERSKTVEALTHFLASTGSLSETTSNKSAAQRGRELFHQVGCVACHNPQFPEPITLASSIPLDNLTDKYSVPSLTSFLMNPLEVRPSGRMPHMNLNEQEAREVASYLLPGIVAKANTAYEYFEGNWQELPNFAELKAITSGESSGLDLNVANRKDNFAIRFRTMLPIREKGRYRFHLGSDDGSRLYVNGKAVVTVNGIHPYTESSHEIELEAKLHSIEVEYFEGGGEEVLRLEYEGPGIGRRSVDSDSVLNEAQLNENNTGLKLDPKLIELGGKSFATLGCANCHSNNFASLNELKGPSAKPLLELKSGSCSSKGAVYQLTSEQKAALGKGLAYLASKPGPRTKPQFVTDHLVRFNCVACHVRGELGGIEEERLELFVGKQPEMGDEGRIPPMLHDVGAKLQRGWMENVLVNGAKERPYMVARMPKFPNPHTYKFMDAVIETDKLKETFPIDTDESERKLKVHGRKLAGNQALSCIKCHTFAGSPSTGVQGLSLTNMTKRLNKDWFQKYILDPNRLRPGTRMPSSFPNGQSFYPDMLGGKPNNQIHAIWVYLADGNNASPPVGLETSSIELVAETEPVIYRNFIEGAGSRAIGVGYPEKLNLAFDANDMRLALIWQGAFIDASRHWNDRGVGYQPPLGDNIFPLPKGVAFAKLDSADAPWPNKTAKQLDIRFKGYRYNEKRQPIFSYTVAGVMLEDAFVPTVDMDLHTLSRKISLPGSGLAGWTFRVAAAGKISKINATTFDVDGVKIVVRSKQTPVIRDSNGSQELLLPIEASADPIEIDYVW